MRKNKNVMKAVAFGTALCLGISALCFAPVKAEGNSSFPGAGNEVKTQNQMKEMEKYVSVLPTVKGAQNYEKFSVPVHGPGEYPTNSTGDEVLPEKYCSEDIEDGSIAKNQNPFGTCWAHAAIANLENSLIKKGVLNPNRQVYTRENTDLSERHLSYFTYHDTKDPLGGTDGDSSTIEVENYLDAGGFDFSALLTLAAWRGVVSENVAPYSEVVQNKNNIDACDLDENIGMNHEATLRNCKYINFSDRDEIKRMIMENGACVVSICYTNKWLNNNLRYCAPPNYMSNHDVTIVGWDDTDSKEKYQNTPSGDGCWIVRNSWGPQWGHNGYFYLSYYDGNVSPTSNASARCFMGQRGDLYDHNYQYDGSAYLKTGYLFRNEAIANRFTVPAKSNCEELRAVSFGVRDVQVKYSIQIYKNPTTTDPASGEALLANPQTGMIDYAGYYTIPLKQPVKLHGGDAFSVVIALNAVDEAKDYVRYFADPASEELKYVYSNGETAKIYKFKNRIQSGESFKKSGTKWQNMTDYTPRIKAFTVDMKVRYLGDLNGDGYVNRTDCMAFNSAERYYSIGLQKNQRMYSAAADLDHDGDIDADDNMLLSKAAGEPRQEVNINHGDINGDGLIDVLDTVAMQGEIAKYGTQGYVNGRIYYKAEADMDENGTIDQYDAKVLHEMVYGF